MQANCTEENGHFYTPYLQSCSKLNNTEPNFAIAKLQSLANRLIIKDIYYSNICKVIQSHSYNRKKINLLIDFANFVSILELQSYDFLFYYYAINQTITFLVKAKYPQNSEKIPKKLVKIILNLTILNVFFF